MTDFQSAVIPSASEGPHSWTDRYRQMQRNHCSPRFVFRASVSLQLRGPSLALGMTSAWWLPGDQDRVVPLVALAIVLREVFPLRPRFEYLELRITREGAKAVRVNAPAIDRKAMFRTTRWRDDAKQSAGLHCANNLLHREPEKLR